jgi:hypothetical protein
VQYYSAGGGATVDGAQLTHRTFLKSPPATTQTFTLRSSSHTATNGFSLLSRISGFGTFQGNPDQGEFTWLARLTSTFLGESVEVIDAGVARHGEGNVEFFRAKLRSFKGKGTGPLVSVLELTTSGIGELHMEDTGISALAVPEPSTWLLMLAGFGMVGTAIRRERRNPGLAA